MNGNSRTWVCAIRGPIMLITVGALFALNNFTPYGFNSTWPVLLIVFGLLTMLARGAAPATPAGGPQPPYMGGAGGFAPQAGQAEPPAPPYAAGPGSYRQTPYTQPPAGTVKGGFGTSAPQRPPEPPPPTGGDV